MKKAFLIAVLLTSTSFAQIGAPEDSVNKPVPEKRDVSPFHTARSNFFNDSTGRRRKLDSVASSGQGFGEVWDYAPLPAIPADKADAIFVATVTSFQPFFSADHTRIYTEYRLVTTDSIKGNPKQNVSLLMPGGTILKSDGRKIRYIPDSRERPDVGRKYLFFVRRVADLDAYLLLKIWELTNEHPRPMAGEDVRAVREHKLNYATMSNEQFVQTVRSIAANCRSRGSPRGSRPGVRILTPLRGWEWRLKIT
jgi:hypothetical protein